MNSSKKILLICMKLKFFNLHCKKNVWIILSKAPLWFFRFILIKSIQYHKRNCNENFNEQLKNSINGVECIKTKYSIITMYT